MESKTSEDKWKKKLTKEQYSVLRKKGTEPAFPGKYYNFKESGIYKCVCCGYEPFNSEEISPAGPGGESASEEDGGIEEGEESNQSPVISDELETDLSPGSLDEITVEGCM